MGKGGKQKGSQRITEKQIQEILAFASFYLFAPVSNIEDEGMEL